MCVCERERLCVCDHEAPIMRMPWPTKGSCAKCGGGRGGRCEGKAIYSCVFYTIVNQLPDDDHDMGRNSS